MASPVNSEPVLPAEDTAELDAILADATWDYVANQKPSYSPQMYSIQMPPGGIDLDNALMAAQKAMDAQKQLQVLQQFGLGQYPMSPPMTWAPSPSSIFANSLEELATPTPQATEPGEIYPEELTRYATHITREEYGGKAYGLRRIAELGVAIPPTHALPCSATFTRPTVRGIRRMLRNWGLQEGEDALAVRSGAPVSMPGLLATELNVPLDEASIREAIDAVWASWNTERAVAYRRERGIEDTMGTGVLLQQQIPAYASGVAFTADPNAPHLADCYDPQIEHVLGLGDKLVDGTAPTLPGFPADERLRRAHIRFLGWLKKIHDAYGPSDVEWCVTKDGYVYFLQWRPLRFVQLPTESDGAVPEGVGETLARGLVVGQPKVYVGRLTDSILDLQPGDILYAQEFSPDTYLGMLKASGIICCSGGPLCHAAIVARDLGRPAVSGIRWETIEPSLGKYIAILPDGRICAATQPTTVEPVVAAAPPVLDESRCPRAVWLDHPDEQVSVQRAAVRFYGNFERVRTGAISEEVFQGIVRELADVMGGYFYWATACEARHAHDKIPRSLESRMAIERVQDCGISIPSYGTSYTPGRVEFVGDSMGAPPTLAAAIAAVEALVHLYDDCPWSGGGFGGVKWGAIARILLSYLKGEISPTAFVDSCFNLQHNGGGAFNKFYWMGFNQGWLLNLLNARKKSYEKLLAAGRVYWGEHTLDWITAPSFWGLTAIQPLLAYRDLPDAIAGTEGTETSSSPGPEPEPGENSDEDDEDEESSDEDEESSDNSDHDEEDEPEEEEDDDSPMGETDEEDEPESNPTVEGCDCSSCQSWHQTQAAKKLAASLPVKPKQEASVQFVSGYEALPQEERAHV